MTHKTNNAKKFAETIIANSYDFFNKTEIKHLIDDLKQELIDKYQKTEQYLDTQFISEISANDHSKILSRLWEIILLNKLLKNSNIEIAQHSDNGPDWRIKLKNDYTYYVEATCAQLPNKKDNKDNSEIHRKIEETSQSRTSFSDQKLATEAKSRISNALSKKIKKHKSYTPEKKCGYILAISYGSLPFYASCDLYQAVQTIIPIGALCLDINLENLGNPSVVKKYLKYEDHYTKPSSTNNSTIQTNIFDNEEYNWISAILLSKVDPHFLLETMSRVPGISWHGEVTNDFVLIHNPKAIYPLLENIFESRTIIRIKDNKLTIEGNNIFPLF